MNLKLLAALLLLIFGGGFPFGGALVGLADVGLPRLGDLASFLMGGFRVKP